MKSWSEEKMIENGSQHNKEKIMTLFILSLLSFADEKTTIDFEEVNVKGTIKKPSFQRVVEVKRPEFKPLTELCFPRGFRPVIDI